MGGNSPIRYGLIERALRRGGKKHTRTRGSHHNWIYRGRAFTIVVHGNAVKAQYIRRLREFWSLREDDGVSDKEFWDGKWPGKR
jgi:predicted RNA binding protein YcfA (HicA-like mRNA interferase family)